ncbi:Transcription initiation factor TFIID subunit [Klebsormidium nitens]|uniref:Transcription initiation factor TFIID subunit n=1 Tax=Klebsormidium nitens TaxID=105231 RepID=A0A1Y1IPH5_KLENI|nr:Transcription initiation factor TFIID subunit [Klebsormidium nitens]|eukprot:GAQ90686.1 Transcription initiation factor TFIID subunit [Klebsormidium nitens]
MAVEEQFILRVPQDIAEQLNQLLSKQIASADLPIDLAFSEDGRSGTFTVGGRTLPASLLDLPGVVESWKTYDDNHLVKSADIGQLILVTEEGAEKPEGPEYRHGLTPPMREARRQRFRSEPEYDPEQVARVEKELERILQGGGVRDMEVEEVLEDEEEEEEGADGDAEEQKKKKKKKKKKHRDRDKDKEDGKREKSSKKKHKSKDKERKKDEEKAGEKEKLKEKKSKKHKKKDKEASGDGLESDSKRVRVDPESQAVEGPRANGGADEVAASGLGGLEKGLGETQDAAADLDADRDSLDDLLTSPGQEPEATDADFERELMESLGGDGILDGGQGEGTGREVGVGLEGKGDGEGNGLDDGLEGNGGMFSFTGLEGAELNDNAFDFGVEDGGLPAAEDDRGEEKPESMPWDL